MRIRRRSIAGTLLSSSSSDKAVTSACTDREEEDVEEMGRGREFLLPLAVAAAEVGGGDGNGGIHLHPRRAHNWRNALFRRNAPDEAVQVRGEGDNSNYGWNGIIRGNREDKLALLTSEGRLELPGSSVNQEITQLKLPTSDGSEKFLMWEKRKPHTDESTVTKTRNKLDRITKCHVIRHINAGAFKLKSKESIQRDKPKTKCKGDGDDSSKESYMHAGSQCRRRNGRGWRCSERTLVGYHLCEHHLGKGRLKSINNSNTKGGEASVAVNNKGTKFKELHLIH